MEHLPSERNEEERIQRFQFGPWVFNVNRAQAILAESPREPKLLPVVQWARFYGLDSHDGPGLSLFTPLPSFDRDYAMTTDLDNPLLMATLRSHDGKEFALLIDGTHRLYRAFIDGVAELPAHVLTAEESLAIREDGLVGGEVFGPVRDRPDLLDEPAESEHGGDA